MPEWLTRLVDWLVAAPDAVFLVTLGLTAAVENIVPPIPADVVVLVGSVLGTQAGTHLGLLFVAVWLGNVAGALAVYFVGRRYGLRFFQGPIGRLLLHPDQLAMVGGFYQRYGFPVIFLSRFLPMFRAVVPVFAGLSRVSFTRTAIPIATASAIWYGALVFVGATAGRHWDVLVRQLDSVSTWLWIAAALVAVPVIVWWRRTRRVPEERDEQ
jgi:membrane protein DedA with SNARE-associated domain